MCGRYSFKPLPTAAADLPGVPPDVEQTNIAPTERAPVFLNTGVWDMCAWGLLPPWSNRTGGRLINARAETVAQKPAFRDAYRNRRCLVPADAFYEWERAASGEKIPHRIFRKDGHMMLFAGIWAQQWLPDQQAIWTFAIITTTANEDVQPLHDRMPVILSSPADQASWLNEEHPDLLQALLTPAPAGTLLHNRVTKKLNKPGYRGPLEAETEP